jgi:hypothetical protein
VTQNNSASADQSASASREMSELACSLNHLVAELQEIITGDAGDLRAMDCQDLEPDYPAPGNMPEVSRYRTATATFDRPIRKPAPAAVPAGAPEQVIPLDEDDF